MQVLIIHTRILAIYLKKWILVVSISGNRTRILLLVITIQNKQRVKWDQNQHLTNRVQLEGLSNIILMYLTRAFTSLTNNLVIFLKKLILVVNINLSPTQIRHLDFMIPKTQLLKIKHLAIALERNRRRIYIRIREMILALVIMMVTLFPLQEILNKIWPLEASTNSRQAATHHLVTTTQIALIVKSSQDHSPLVRVRSPESNQSQMKFQMLVNMNLINNSVTYHKIWP